MSDYDVIEKLSKFLDAPIRTYVPSGKNVSGDPYKTQHSIRVYGRKAWVLMQKAEPYLSKRRKEQISYVRENYKPKTTFKTEGYVSKKKPIFIPLFD